MKRIIISLASITIIGALASAYIHHNSPEQVIGRHQYQCSPQANDGFDWNCGKGNQPTEFHIAGSNLIIKGNDTDGGRYMQVYHSTGTRGIYVFEVAGTKGNNSASPIWGNCNVIDIRNSDDIREWDVFTRPGDQCGFRSEMELTPTEHYWRID